MKLSVIITAFDSHEVTVLHVKECMNSTRVPDEVIVINDHGDPSLKEMLQKIDKKCPLIYAYILDDIPWNYTGARNLGYWLSRGDILSMEDNDHIPSRGLYEEAMEYVEQNPNVGRVLSGKRPKIFKKEALSLPMEKWTSLGSRQTHQDTQFLRREVYMKVKGCDERFAGAYAWACTDWRRRLQRAEIETGSVHASYWAIVDGETSTLVRRKSYRNYEYARENDEHIQSPIGIMNF